jgi:hypothetical protein
MEVLFAMEDGHGPRQQSWRTARVARGSQTRGVQGGIQCKIRRNRQPER